MENALVLEEMSCPIQEQEPPKLALVKIKKGTQEISSSLFFEENPNIAKIFKIKEWDIIINLIQQHKIDYWLKDDRINIFEKLFDRLDKKMSKLDINVPKITVLNISEVIFVLGKYWFDISWFLDLFRQFKINLYKIKASFWIEYHKKYTNEVAIFVDEVEKAIEELKILWENVNDFELWLATIKITTLKSRVRNDIDYILYTWLSV